MNTCIDTKTMMDREAILQSGRRYWRLRRVQEGQEKLLHIQGQEGQP